MQPPHPSSPGKEQRKLICETTFCDFFSYNVRVDSIVSFYDSSKNPVIFENDFESFVVCSPV